MQASPIHRRRQPQGLSLRHGGFTLVELLVSVAVSTILLLIMSQTISAAATTQHTAQRHEEILRNATAMHDRLAELLANTERSAVDIDTSNNDWRSVPASTFAMKSGFEGGQSDDILMFTTRAVKGKVKKIDPETGDELTDEVIAFAPQTVMVYIRPSSHPSLRELVLHRLGVINQNWIQANVGTAEAIENFRRDHVGEPTVPTEEISVLCRFISEFKIEYLDIGADEFDEKGVRLQPKTTGERDFLTPSESSFRLDVLAWHVPFMRSLHDRYDRAELTTPRALRFTVTLRARDSGIHRRFHMVVPVRSAHVIDTSGQL